MGGIAAECPYDGIAAGRLGKRQAILALEHARRADGERGERVRQRGRLLLAGGVADVRRVMMPGNSLVQDGDFLVVLHLTLRLGRIYVEPCRA